MITANQYISLKETLVGSEESQKGPSLEELAEIFGWLAIFVQDYGYLAVFLGSMIEGESIIFIAGYFAQQGVLSLPKLILISFLGTLIADQGLYFVGRYYGNHFLDRFPSFKNRTEKAFSLLKRYDNYFILSFRFIYGIRIISPVVIGSCGIGVKRFMVLNFFAAVIWSVGSCLAAYYFAHFLIGCIDLVPKIILGIALVGGTIGYLIFKWRKRLNS